MPGEIRAYGDRAEKLKLSQLRAFAAVATSGSFGEAALILEVSQSAISHAIAALEEELGVVLLSRGRYGARLTPIGEKLLVHAQRILADTEALRREASVARGLQSGCIRIASFRSAAAYLLPAAIARFRHSYPGIEVEVLDFNDCLRVDEVVTQGLADIGLTHLPAAEGFFTWPLLDDEYIAIFPPTLATADGNVTWECFGTWPMVMMRELDACWRLISGHFQAHGKPLHVTHRFAEDSTIVSMVAQGMGATILARMAAEPLPPGLLTSALPVPLHRTIGVAALRNALQVPAVYAFIDTLRDACHTWESAAARGTLPLRSL